eukprot:TRINITY_DN14884_c0_g1_i1.p1 TRINITY_DN14884_c0_g1~~TRINITY_DN14884_c0_g1_i1.p1  ORF type:complete len:176 (+),score=36.63 TRINITY_DN14884_c0_g1_i1:41-529(+)
MTERQTIPYNISEDIPPTITQVIEDPGLCESFKKHLEESYCLENLLFINSVQAFVNINDPDERKEYFGGIMKDFLIDGAPYQIHVPSAIRKELEKRKNDPQKDAFYELWNEVLNVLRIESLPRFLQGRSYKALKEHPERQKARLEKFFGETISDPQLKNDDG